LVVPAAGRRPQRQRQRQQLVSCGVAGWHGLLLVGVDLGRPV